RIPEIMQQRLLDIGNWLKVNGEAIYGTRKWEKAPAVTNETTQFFTRKGNDLYLIITKWQDKPITISGVSNPSGVEMPGYTGKIKFSFSAGRLTIIPPVITPANMPCSYAWVFRIRNCLR
ncbi:MAG TPA: alpha-L-fucosidase C-terminal domain-containing protein, partial [Bacteroidales bacterium]|nr:alpha-L-fucosidase C-terminal domain-containing protein [Bacteroidales bacterium]